MARAAEELRDGHDIYCDIFCTLGKKVLAKMLRWHKGNFDYYSYLEGLCFFERMEDFDATDKYNLKYKEPEEYSFMLLHLLFHFTCKVLNTRKRKGKENLYENLYAFVNVIIKEALCCRDVENLLSNNQMAEQLHSAFLLFVQALKISADILDVPRDEYLSFITEMESGMLAHPGFRKNLVNPNDNSVQMSELGKAYTAIVFNTIREIGKCSRGDIVGGHFRSVLLKRDKEESCDINKLFPMDMFKGKYGIVSQSTSEKFESEMSQKLIAPSTKSLCKKVHKYDMVTKPVVETDSLDETHTKPSQVGSESQSKLHIETRSELDASAKQFEDNSAFCEINSNSSSTGKGIDSREHEDISDEVQNTNVFDEVKESLEPILESICASLYEHSDLPMNGNVDPSSSLYSYQGIILKQHHKYSQKPGQVVDLSSLLSVKGMDDNEAQIILLSGGPGMGKSWLMNYIQKIYKAGVCDDTFKFLFSCQLENNSCDSILQLVVNACKEQMKNVKEKDRILREMLKYPTLILLDGYHDIYENCQHLVREVLGMMEGNLKVFITCRPHYVDHVYALIPKKRKKHLCHLRLEAVPPSLHTDFVSRILDCGDLSLNANSIKLNHIKQGLISQLPHIYDIVGDGMCNPLMLKIITKMWTEHSNV